MLFPERCVVKAPAQVRMSPLTRQSFRSEMSLALAIYWKFIHCVYSSSKCNLKWIKRLRLVREYLLYIQPHACHIQSIHICLNKILGVCVCLIGDYIYGNNKYSIYLFICKVFFDLMISFGAKIFINLVCTEYNYII